VQYDPAFLPLGNVSVPSIFTVFPAVVTALLYAGLLQFVRKHAAMVFTVISAITFVVTLIPGFTYIPTVDGVSNAEIAVLVVMHAIAAAVITHRRQPEGGRTKTVVAALRGTGRHPVCRSAKRSGRR
jgi:uncharacterized membrane protein